MQKRIDAHQHFWRLDRGDYRWLQPGNAALKAIYRNFMPDDLQLISQPLGVVKTVLVQAADSEAETDFMLCLAAGNDLIGGVVGWVDISDPASTWTLERWAKEPKFKGVRPMLQDLPDLDWIARKPHPDVMACIAELGLRLDALVLPAHLDALLQFVRAHSSLPIVIDHAAKPRLDKGWHAVWAHAWRRDMAALAAHPNVLCKFSGLLTETHALDPLAAIKPVWDDLLRWFGPGRLMWGSDWPVVNLAADYERWLDIARALIDELPEADRRRIWHDNAQTFYGL